jgi:hypothetical protein
MVTADPIPPAIILSIRFRLICGFIYSNHEAPNDTAIVGIY